MKSRLVDDQAAFFLPQPARCLRSKRSAWAATCRAGSGRQRTTLCAAVSGTAASSTTGSGHAHTLHQHGAPTAVAAFTAIGQSTDTIALSWTPSTGQTSYRIERSVAGKRALEELKSYSTTRQKIIDSDDQELKELEKGMQDASMSEEARKEKQEHFRTKLEAYQRRIQDFNREVQEKQRGMVAEYAQKIQAAAATGITG